MAIADELGLKSRHLLGLHLPDVQPALQYCVMAFINEFLEVDSDVQRLHGPVVCGYRTFTVDGRPVLQLDTYGSVERQIPNKVSQSLQLDVEGARVLRDILLETFPELQA
ncbi:hypothetical protein [Streptomyces syringium]|uniref:hypothetical protein n=1 Tax=Streptomyces syringium TaxID=76729 RepID=UPI00340B742B